LVSFCPSMGRENASISLTMYLQPHLCMSGNYLNQAIRGLGNQLKLFSVSIRTFDLFIQPRSFFQDKVNTVTSSLHTLKGRTLITVSRYETTTVEVVKSKRLTQSFNSIHCCYPLTCSFRYILVCAFHSVALLKTTERD